MSAWRTLFRSTSLLNLRRGSLPREPLRLWVFDKTVVSPTRCCRSHIIRARADDCEHVADIVSTVANSVSRRHLPVSANSSTPQDIIASTALYDCKLLHLPGFLPSATEIFLLFPCAPIQPTRAHFGLVRPGTPYPDGHQVFKTSSKHPSFLPSRGEAHDESGRGRIGAAPHFPRRRKTRRAGMLPSSA